MTTNESYGSSCSLPTPAQDLAQKDESSSDTESDTSPVVSEDTNDYPDYGQPGTIDQHGIDHPECKELNRYVKNLIAKKWSDVGMELFHKDDISQLDTIEADNPGDAEACCKKMLKLWVEIYPEATWNDLIKSLKAPGVKLCDTASKIEGMLLPSVFDSEKHECEPMNAFVEMTSDATVMGEKLSFRSSYQQQISKDPLQEFQLAKLSQCVIPTQQHVYNTGGVGVAHALDNTSHGERPNSLPFVEKTKRCLPPNDWDDVSSPVMVSGDDSNKSARVYKAVSEYYSGQFVDRWKSRTGSSTINNLAALLFEKDKTMKVVVFTAGAPKKGECSYSINNGSADECMWGHCGGHAVSMCYRLASFFLITEMHRYKKDRQTSILEAEPGGYQLKEGIKLHFFTTSIPCGFMANKEDHYLSWKIPFKGKPHCLKCSSIILIDAYLGIQGPLSHLFKKPVYISSITIPDVTALKCAKIKKQFEDFDVLLKKANKTTDNGYKFHTPHVEIVESKSSKFFPKCFRTCNSFSYTDSFQPTENQTEGKQAAGAVPDVEGNLGSHMMVFDLKHGIGAGRDKFCKKMISQLKNATKDFPHHTKLFQLNLLVNALKKLSETLNVGKALKELKNCINKEMDRKIAPGDQSVSAVIVQLKEMEQWRSEMTIKVKESLHIIVRWIEDDCNTQVVEKSSSWLRQKFEHDSKLVMESLDSLNKNTKEFENDAKSIINGLTDYCAYKETLDDLNCLLEKNDFNCCDLQFCLEFMGCDWARNMGAINNDIKGDYGTVLQPSTLAQQQQQQVSSDVLDNAERNTVQELQNETAMGVDLQSEVEKPEDKVLDVTDSYGSGSQTSRLPSVPEEEENKQHQYDRDNNNIFSKQLENEAQQESQTGITESCEAVMPHVVTGGYGVVPQVCDLPSSYQQHQGSKLVFNSNIERSMIEKLHPQNHTVVQEEDQHEQKMVTPTKTAALTAHTCTVTQQKSEVTIPEVTVSQSEITMPKVRRISIASEMIRSPLMIMMFALLITVIFIYVVFDINWSNAAFYFDRYVETEFL